jgi:hypothetical protein
VNRKRTTDYADDTDEEKTIREIREIRGQNENMKHEEITAQRSRNQTSSNFHNVQTPQHKRLMPGAGKNPREYALN